MSSSYKQASEKNKPTKNENETTTRSTQQVNSNESAKTLKTSTVLYEMSQTNETNKQNNPTNVNQETTNANAQGPSSTKTTVKVEIDTSKAWKTASRLDFIKIVEEEDQAHFKLGNDFMATLTKECYMLDEDNVYLNIFKTPKNFMDEVFGNIDQEKQAIVNNQIFGEPSLCFIDETMEKQQMDFNKNRSMNFSKHWNFLPEERFKITPTPALCRTLDLKYIYTMKQLVDYVQGCYPDSLVVKCQTRRGTVTFIPKEHFGVFWNNCRLTVKNTNAHFATTLLVALSNQAMTRKQYCKLISIATTIQIMSNTKVMEDVKLLIRDFLYIAERFCKAFSFLIKLDKDGNQISFSRQDFINIFMTLDHYIPYRSGYDNPEVCQYEKKNIHNFHEQTRFFMQEFAFDKEEFGYYITPEELPIFNIVNEAFQNGRITFAAFERCEMPYTTKELVGLFKSGLFHSMWTTTEIFDLTKAGDKKKLFLTKQRMVRSGKTNGEIFIEAANGHTHTNEHHVEFWKDKEMSIQATVEMLCDHWSCARRTNKNYDIALYSSLSWLDGPKFKVVNPKGVAYFLAAVSRLSFKNTYHPGMATNYNVWFEKFTTEEVREMMFAYQDREAKEWLISHMPDDRIKAFVRDILIHQNDVNYLYKAITQKEILHDADKASADYALALLMKFGTKDQNISLEVDKPVLTIQTTDSGDEDATEITVEAQVQTEDPQPSTSGEQEVFPYPEDPPDVPPIITRAQVRKELAELQQEALALIERDAEVKDLRKQAQDIRDAEAAENAQKEEQPGYFARMKNFLKKPFQVGKDVFENVTTIKETLVSLEDRFKSFTSEPMPDVGKIESAYGLMGTALNNMARELLNKLVGVVGIEFDFEKVDTVKIVFYYLIWINTDNKTLKTILFVDMLISLGVFDALMKIYDHYRKVIPESMITTTQVEYKDCDCWICETFEVDRKVATLSVQDEIQRLQGNIAGLKVKNEVEEQNVEKPPVTEAEKEEGWFVKILHQIASGSTFALGALGAALVTALGVKSVITPTKIGELIVKSAKNIHYLTLGVIAIPKLFSNFVAVVHWASDYVKAFFIKKHQTKHQLTKKIEDWVDRTRMFHAGVTEPVMASSVSVCHQVISEYLVGSELSPHFRLLEPPLRIECSKRLLDLGMLYTKATTYSRIQAGAKEPFHVQFHGAPGCGKTDLTRAVSRELSKHMKIDPAEYPYNENLSHMDGYAGQKVAIVDETNASNTVDSNNLMKWLMICSGAPHIAQMADLGEKGRLVEFELILSSTNTPYPKLKDVNCLDALYRRRVLIGVRVRPEFLDDNQQVNDVAIEEAGLDRTRCEHLEFTISDKLKSTHAFIDPFGFDDLLTYLKLSAEKHQLIEKQRALVYGMENRQQIISEYNQIHKFLISSTAHESSKYYQMMKEHFAAAKDYEKHRLMSERAAEFGENTTTTSFDSANIDLVWMKTTWATVSKIPMIPVAKGPINFDNLVILNTTKFFDFNVREDKDMSDTLRGHYLWWMDLIRVQSGMDPCLAKGVYATIRAQHDLHVAESIAKEKVLREKWTIYKRVKGMFKSGLKWLWNTLIRTVQIAIGTVLAFGVIVGITKLLGNLFGNKKEVTYIGSQKQLKTTTSLSTNYFDHNATLAQKHIYIISAKKGSHTSKQTCIGLQGNYFLVSKHFFDDEYESNVAIYDPITKTENTFPVDFKKGLKEIPGADGSILFIPGFRAVSHAIKHFVKEEDLDEDMLAFRSFDGYLVALNPNDPQLTVTERMELTRHNWDGQCVRDGKNYEITSERTVMGRRSIMQGNSGGILIHSNTKIARPFLGMAMATWKSQNQSYYTIVTQEMLQKVIDSFQKPNYTKLVIHRNEDNFDYSKTSEYAKVSNMPSIASFSPPVPINTKSEIYPTPIYPLGQVDCQPAILGPNDKRCEGKTQHPYDTSLNKYVFKSILPISTQELKHVNDFLEDAYMNVRNMSQVTIWNTKNAIVGSMQANATPINLSSSPGLPYKLRAKKPGKSDWISFNQNLMTYEIAQEVFSDVEEYIMNVKKGYIVQYPKLEFLKDEVVSNTKIENPRTRTVATGNFVHTIIYRRIFGDLMRTLKTECKGDFFCAVGVNYESSDWDNLVTKRLRGDNPDNLNNIVALDVKGWDSVPTLALAQTVAQAKVNVLKRAYKSRNETFPEWVEDTALALCVDFVDTNVVFGDFIYHKAKGMLSGHPGTLLENSDMHAGLLYIIYRRCVTSKNRLDLCNLKAFKQHVRFVLAADDVILALTSQILGVFSVTEFLSGYTQLGIQITGADKSNKIDLVNIRDADFLKMQFTFDGVFWKPRPKDTIVYQLLNWQRKTTGYFQQFQTNLLAAFRFKYWHGEQSYEELREIVNTQLFKLQMNTFDISYNDMHNLIARELKLEQFYNQISSRERLDPNSKLNNIFFSVTAGLEYD